MLIPIHVWIVKDEDGVTLVDAGIPFMAKGIQQFIETLNAGPLKRVMLTHGHGDHTGAILKILNVTQVPIFAHRIEIPYIEGELPYPRRKKAAISIPKQITQALPETNQGVLQTMGGLTPYLTPGHSPGHVVYYHQQDQVLLAGDLFTAKKGELRKPMAMFTADMTEAIRSSSIVREIKPLRLEVCHGSSVLQPANQLDTYLKS
ncbi:MBL fold metallo-hydrolase [Paenibacillus crassostreae]|nr:MBL fold metallo-hydrolase [Paenibacillus crassostreae]